MKPSQSTRLLPALFASALLANLPSQLHAAGATTPFVSFEAEAGTLAGGASVSTLTAPPTTEFSSPELEASGHGYVRLDATGESVQWTNTTGQNISAINVRASIPDSAGGGGITATLDLYVNGTFRQTLNFNSQQTWLYEGGSGNYNGNNQNPANGNPRVFFDESHAFITGAAVAPGSTIRLQKSAANTAAFYHIDVVDLEAPPAPIARPANSLIITDYGAVANNSGTDNSTAIQNCINAAQSQGKSVWIPQGTFYVRSQGGLNANGVTIQGAGMWHSTIYRNMTLPNPSPLGAVLNVTSCTLRNFAIDTNAKSRTSADGCGGAMDTSGTNWLTENIWVQHAMSGLWASGTGGTVRNCRLTSIWADGINLNNVALNATVGNNLTSTHNFIRGTGDDAHAINSVDWNDYGNGNIIYYTRMANTTVSNNTSIGMWGGKGQSIYGGLNQVVKDNYMSDTARYIGLGVGKFGANGSDLESATVTGNVVARCGGNAYLQKQPALMIGNGGDGHSTGTVENAYVGGNTISNSLYNAVGFSESDGITFQRNTVTSPGLDAIVINPPFYPAPAGSAFINANVVTGLAPGRAEFLNLSAGYVAIAPILGSSYASMTGVQLENCSEGGQNVSHIEAGDSVAYTGVVLDGSNTFVARVATPSTGGTIQIRLGSPTGTLLGSCPVTTTGNWQTWTNVYCNITPTSGSQTIYLVFTGGGGGLFNLQWLGFYGPAANLQPGTIVALESVVNGKYVCAENAGANPLIANRNSPGPWETFDVLDAGGGKIALRARINNLVVCADNGGANPLIANRTSAGAWESFTPASAGSGRIALRANANNLYVSATSSGSGNLIANQATIGTSESFIIHVIP